MNARQKANLKKFCKVNQVEAANERRMAEITIQQVMDSPQGAMLKKLTDELLTELNKF
jgi:hypothetical protein